MDLLVIYDGNKYLVSLSPEKMMLFATELDIL